MGNLSQDIANYVASFIDKHRLNPVNVMEGYKQIANANDPKKRYFDAAKEMANDFLTKYSQQVMTPENYAMQPMGLAGQISNLYHGSPYKFNKFANEKIGTGEGAQSFGWGHYLTELKEVAKGYRKKGHESEKLVISGGKEYKYLHSNPSESELVKSLALDTLVKFDGNMAKTMESLLSPQNHPNYHKAAEWLKDNIKDNPKIVDTGNIYTATINKGKPSSADVFLEWDKKFKDQSPKVQEIIRKIWDENKIYGNPEQFTGEGIYDSILAHNYKYGMAKRPGQEVATKDLMHYGVTGIKYPTGTLSGIKGSTKYNYVVFDPENITIDAINGIPVK